MRTRAIVKDCESKGKERKMEGERKREKGAIHKPIQSDVLVFVFFFVRGMSIALYEEQLSIA